MAGYVLVLCGGVVGCLPALTILTVLISVDGGGFYEEVVCHGRLRERERRGQEVERVRVFRWCHGVLDGVTR